MKRSIGVVLLVSAFLAFVSGSARGQEWQTLRSGPEQIAGIWGTSPKDIFVVSGYTGERVTHFGEVTHFDGTAWSRMACNLDMPGAFHAVWGASPTDVYAGGGSVTSGVIAHYDGSSWSVSASGLPSMIWGIWGSSAADIFAFSYHGEIHHYDGVAWSQMTRSIDLLGSTARMLGIWGSSPTDVFIVGQDYDGSRYGSFILHYDGKAWTAMDLPSTGGGANVFLTAIWGASAQDVYAVGDYGVIVHYDGKSWTLVHDGGDMLTNVWGASPTDIWAIGHIGGGVLHFDGVAWQEVPWSWPAGPAGGWINGIWGASPTDVFMVDLNTVYRLRDGEPTIAVLFPSFGSVWGTSSTDVYVGGNGPILHSDGAAWTTTTLPVQNNYVTGLWGSSPTDLFAAFDAPFGSPTVIVHGNGASWSPMSTPVRQSAHARLWGSSGKDVFAAGYYGWGELLHFDGTAWQPVQTGIHAIYYAIWGASPTNVFAAGPEGAIAHFDGKVWTPMDSGTTAPLLGLWGSSASDVFAVGFGGTILHFNGTAWSSMDSGFDAALLDVWGTSPGNVYAVGEGGMILHYDGSSWRPMASGTGNTLTAVWGSSSADVYAVGYGNTIVHLGPPSAQWSFANSAAGRLIGAAEWAKVSGTWSVDAHDRFCATSVAAKNLATVRATILPSAAAERIEMRSTMASGSAAANAMALFAFQSASKYRYVQLLPGAIRIGQTGTYGGCGTGVKKQKAFPVQAGSPAALRVDVRADGSVTAYVNGRPALSYRFPSAPAGAVGLGADSATARFADFRVWDGSTLP